MLRCSASGRAALNAAVGLWLSSSGLRGAAATLPGLNFERRGPRWLTAGWSAEDPGWQQKRKCDPMQSTSGWGALRWVSALPSISSLDVRLDEARRESPDDSLPPLHTSEVAECAHQRHPVYNQKVPEWEVRVGSNSSPKMVAAAIAGIVRKRTDCCVLCTGASAVNQAVKSIAIARTYMQERDGADLVFRTGHRSKLDMNTPTRMYFWVSPRAEGKFELPENADVSKVKRTGNVMALGAALKHSAERSHAAGLIAVGVNAVSQAVVGMTWARRMLMARGKDVRCYADFRNVDIKDMGIGLALYMELVDGSDAQPSTIPLPSADSPLADQFATLAVEPVDAPVMPASDLKSGLRAFTQASSADLPSIKVGRMSHPKIVAATLFTQLRFCHGCQLLAAGPIPINQAIKALATARTYTQDHKGYDLAIQCQHAPHQDITPNCQVSFIARLVRPETELPLLEPLLYRVGRDSNCHACGSSMAYSLRDGRGVKVVAVGVGAVSRAVVSCSFARIELEKAGQDMVTFPSFFPIEHQNPGERQGYGIALRCHTGPI